jgi:hypothetical protein
MRSDVGAFPLRHETPGADPERVIVECCAGGAPAVVTLRDAGPSLRAAFTAFRNEQIELELTDAPAPLVPVGAICHVSFLYRERPVTFTSPVRKARPDGERLRVWLAMPSQLSSDGTRGAFRVPATPDPAPRVEVTGDDGTRWQAQLVNLSLTGMFLRFPEALPTLMPDQVLELSVRIGEEHVRLAGVVRRVEAGGAALFFPDAVAGGSENRVRRLLAALERDWHARIRR